MVAWVLFCCDVSGVAMRFCVAEEGEGRVPGGGVETPLVPSAAAGEAII